jgi:hypothetical protein
VTTDVNRLLAWTDEAPPELRARVAGYFASRKEDA